MTITSSNFKRSVVESVKVDVGLPTTVAVTLQVGEVTETVVITGGEILQPQTATFGTTITGRRITETHLLLRDALDTVTLLPGTTTIDRQRAFHIFEVLSNFITLQT